METEMEKRSDGEGEMEGEVERWSDGEGEMERWSGGRWSDGGSESGMDRWGVCSPGCEPASALEPSRSSTPYQGVCSPGCEPASALEPVPGRQPSEWSRAGPASLPPLGCMWAASPVPGLLCRLSSS
ncbi:unnamed protein product [Arctogadus glacialis]